MKLEILASNMTQVQVGNSFVLFSYSTPVAAVVPDKEGNRTFYRTQESFSKTTSNHINKFQKSWDSLPQAYRDQSFFTNLVGE